MPAYRSPERDAKSPKHSLGTFLMRKFISRALVVAGTGFLTPTGGSEPPVPCAFLWDGRTLQITEVLRTWRSTKTDRGDVYLKRHWYELRTDTGAKLEVYYDRESPVGASAWWLYTIDE